MIATILILLLSLLALVGILFFMGRHTFWLPTKDRTWPRLMMLHQVTPDEEASGMNMPPARFERLLQLLVQQKYNFVTVSELVNSPTPKRVALTFDDGFADNYHHAFPLLKKYNAKATIYLTPDIEGIVKLSPAQIQEMAASGLVEFGAHTMHHVNLLNTDDALAMQEISASKQRVAELAGSCQSFAYPFGRFNERHQTMVEKAGFTSAVSTRKRIEWPSTANYYNLPRVSTHGKMSVFQMRIGLAKGRFRF
jgi:peptidoglycan/xylan/chitin deacetylase (PgdA/CDA1 family)